MSQACKEFVERVAGRIRHRRMQGREERESEEGLDIVEGDEDMADMKNGILVRGIKAAKSTQVVLLCGRSLKAVLEKFHLAFDCDSRLCNVV